MLCFVCVRKQRRRHAIYFFLQKYVQYVRTQLLFYVKKQDWLLTHSQAGFSTWERSRDYFILLFPILFIDLLSSPFFLPPSRNSDSGSHSRLSSPLPTTARVLHFYREKSSTLSFRVDLRRIAPTLSIKALLTVDLFYFLQINSRSHHGGIRTPGRTLAIFEGCLLYTSPSPRD